MTIEILFWTPTGHPVWKAPLFWYMAYNYLRYKFMGCCKTFHKKQISWSMKGKDSAGCLFFGCMTHIHCMENCNTSSNSIHSETPHHVSNTYTSSFYPMLGRPIHITGSLTNSQHSHRFRIKAVVSVSEVSCRQQLIILMLESRTVPIINIWPLLTSESFEGSKIIRIS